LPWPRRFIQSPENGQKLSSTDKKIVRGLKVAMKKFPFNYLKTFRLFFIRFSTRDPRKFSKYLTKQSQCQVSTESPAGQDAPLVSAFPGMKASLVHFMNTALKKNFYTWLTRPQSFRE
jgi:hypothetical protein